jgi:hypothetical protein
VGEREDTGTGSSAPLGTTAKEVGSENAGRTRRARSHVSRSHSPIFIEMDGNVSSCNTDEDSFWTGVRRID